MADRIRRGGGLGGFPVVDRRLTLGGRMECGREHARAKGGFEADASDDGGCGGEGWNRWGTMEHES